MKYFIPLVLTSIALSLGSGFAAEPARIATWNVASGRNDAGGTPIPEDRVARLGEIIANQIKPDVLVIEEVFPDSGAADLAKAATKAGFPMEMVEVPKQNPEVVQMVAILKRSGPGVVVKDVSLIDKSDDLVDGDDPEEKTTRKAVLANVKVGKFDFYLVGVHLKSKRISKTIPLTPLEMRDRQCKAIADKLHELKAAGTEKDVLIIGDYNMTPAGQENEGEESDAANFATLDSYQDLRFLSSESKEKTFTGFYKGKIQRSKLDGYAIAKVTESNYVPNSYKVMNSKVLGVDDRQFSDKRVKNWLSDHFPSVAEFDQTKDAD